MPERCEPVGWRRRVPTTSRGRSWQRQNRLNWRSFIPALTVKAERITEDADYQGVRVSFIGYLETARVPIQIDLGFGEVVTPTPAETEFPSLLDFPAPKLLAYPRESVIAEKFEAMVKLGIANSRMKDFMISGSCRAIFLLRDFFPQRRKENIRAAGN